MRRVDPGGREVKLFQLEMEIAMEVAAGITKAFPLTFDGIDFVNSSNVVLLVKCITGGVTKQ